MLQLKGKITRLDKIKNPMTFSLKERHPKHVRQKSLKYKDMWSIHIMQILTKRWLVWPINMSQNKF